MNVYKIGVKKASVDDSIRSDANVPHRIGGLDTLRFVCALWVFFGHGAVPPLAFNIESPVGRIARGIYGNIWNGPAAVIVFFIISGLCIHYPYTAPGARLNLPEFYSRRFLRLMLPVCVAVPVGGFSGVNLSLFHDSILWSLLAELIYYTLYPAFRLVYLRGKIWKGLIISAYVAAFVVILSDYQAASYASFGPALNWLVGLPCWLLGCQIADAVRSGTMKEPGKYEIWYWRLAVLGCAWSCSVLRFHSPLGYPWTLNIFAVLASVWLKREIAFRRSVKPPRLLEWAGAWSYSFYLLHTAAGNFVSRELRVDVNTWSGWLFLCAAVSGFCYLFYLFVEMPSHHFSRLLSRRLGSHHFAGERKRTVTETESGRHGNPLVEVSISK